MERALFYGLAFNIGTNVAGTNKDESIRNPKDANPRAKRLCTEGDRLVGLEEDLNLGGSMV